MEIMPGIHQIDGVNGNCYAISRDGIVLVDSGLPRNSERILGYVRDSLKRDPKSIGTIILTHFHIDHTGNASELRRITGAKIAIHEADADYISGRRTPPGPRGVKGMLFRFLGLFLKMQTFQPDILLRDGQSIAGLTCLHTPGHTPGSVCLLDPGSGVLFSGDLLRYDGERIQGPPPQFTPDMKEAMNSVRKISTIDFGVLLSGHGVPLGGGASEKVREFAGQIP